jgi:ribosomal protein S20
MLPILNMVKTTAKASIKNYLRAVAEKNRDIVAAHYAAVQSLVYDVLQAVGLDYLGLHLS